MNALSYIVLLGFCTMACTVGAQQYDIRVFGVEDGLPGSSVYTISQDSSGFLWVDTDGGLCRFDGRTFRKWSLENVAPPAELHALAPMGRDGWHLPLDPREGHLRWLQNRPGTTCTLMARTGRFWRGTDQGLWVYPNISASEPLMIIDHSSGLRSNNVNCLYEDLSGVIWIGTDQGGLCRYMSEAVTLYGLNGDPFSRVRSFAVSPVGRTFLAGGKDGLVYEHRPARRSGSVEGIDVTAALMLDEQHAIVGTDSGALVVGLGFQGADKNDRIERSLTGARVNMAIRTKTGSNWLALSKGTVTATNAYDWIEAARDTLECTSLAEKGDSMLIGTHRGLYSAPLDNSAANWTPVIRTSGEDINALVVDRAGNVWMGTANAGVVRLRGDQLQRWTVNEGLASDHIRLLLLDAYQNLWVGTDRGFNLMELDELQENVINIRPYGLDEGFPGIEAMPNACIIDADSALWFGTTRGTIRFDPRRILEDPIAPRTRITDLKLFFERPDWKQWCDSLNADGLPIALNLPYDKNHLTFTYSGLSLAYPEKVRFQYKLEGRDAEWSPIIPEDRITFSGLLPGKYTFLVKARNGSGVWNDDPARFAFTIAPPFWATMSFRILGGGSLLLLLFGVQYARERRSRMTRVRLERMVEERTRELTNEKHRSDSLLLNILPESTATELKESGTAQARSYAACTVLFSDFQGFTVLSEQIEATGIVTELDRFFRAFDRITDKFGTEKIKTIGDAYMCASGVPDPTPTHALDAVLMALEMLSVVDVINAKRISEGHPAWPIRIGLNTGPLIAGVVGEKKFAYDVWGDTVNLASRMESNGASGRVNVTSSVLAHVERYVVFEARGKVTLKGKGDVESWFIDRLRPEYSADALGRTANDRLMDIRAALRKS